MASREDGQGEEGQRRALPPKGAPCGIGGNPVTMRRGGSPKGGTPMAKFLADIIAMIVSGLAVALLLRLLGW
jgi:hypothetical protein